MSSYLMIERSVVYSLLVLLVLVVIERSVVYCLLAHLVLVVMEIL